METITALSSGHGKAGVAVIRLSGPDTRRILVEMTGGLPAPREASLRSLHAPLSGEVLDRGLVLWFPGPASFTGEDMAEFHVHGGLAVIEGVLAALAALGARLAEPGEFSRRAFENGKIDLTEAEGLADLIDAETAAQRRQAQRQATGALGQLYEEWRERLIGAMALVEAALDFSDEGDVAADAVSRADRSVETLAGELAAHLHDGHRGEILRDGFRVVLAGPPNAGKSSLLNAIARRDVAIVSAEPGTTRDPIEVRLDLQGLPVIVCDTAGLREVASGEIEREGMRRTLARTQDADLVVWMVDPAAPVLGAPEEVASDRTKVMAVVSKADAFPGAAGLAEAHGAIPISARTGAGLVRLLAIVGAAARDAVGSQEAPALTQVRHRVALVECLRSLEGYLDRPDAGLELRAEDLRTAAMALGRITGRVDAEDVLDQVFGRFCIGK